MEFSFGFVLMSISFGFALAMDAFSVSLANGLNEPKMKLAKMCGVAGMFAFFQALMPMLGWVCIHTVVQYFQVLEALIPWAALVLLCFIGGKMLLEGIQSKDSPAEKPAVSFSALVVQGIATSIDALSVGLSIAHYNLLMALAAAGIIAVVTFIVCMAGLYIGKKAGTKLAGKAGILGGVILILIGFEIFITSFF